MASLPQPPQSPSEPVSGSEAGSEGLPVADLSFLFRSISSIDMPSDSELSDTEHLNISYESPLFTQFSTFFDMVIDLIINKQTCDISDKALLVLLSITKYIRDDEKKIQAFCWHATTKRQDQEDQTVFAQEVADYVQTMFEKPIEHARAIKERVHMLVMSTNMTLNNFRKDSEGAENVDNGSNVSQIDIDPPKDRRHIENILKNIEDVLESQPMDLNNPYNMITRHPKTSDARDVICSTVSVFTYYGYDGTAELFNQAHLQAKYMLKLQNIKLNLSTPNLETISQEFCSQGFRIFKDDSSGMSEHDSTGSDTSQTHTDSAAAAIATTHLPTDSAAAATPLRTHTRHTGSAGMSKHSTPSTPSPEICSPGPLNPVKLIFKARQKMSPNRISPKPKPIKRSKNNSTKLRF